MHILVEGSGCRRGGGQLVYLITIHGGALLFDVYLQMYNHAMVRKQKRSCIGLVKRSKDSVGKDLMLGRTESPRKGRQHMRWMQ